MSDLLPGSGVSKMLRLDVVRDAQFVLIMPEPYPPSGVTDMPFVTTQDGAEIFHKDRGGKDAQPIIFRHGRPLSADDWDTQMPFFLSKGFRDIALSVTPGPSRR